MFEPSLFLNPTSAGVLPDEQFVLAYQQYDPNHVPPQVVASWGPEPIPPSTFAPAGEDAGNAAEAEP
jgi:hypothetical protein